MSSSSVRFNPSFSKEYGWDAAPPLLPEPSKRVVIHLLLFDRVRDVEIKATQLPKNLRPSCVQTVHDQALFLLQQVEHYSKPLIVIGDPNLYTEENPFEYVLKLLNPYAEELEKNLNACEEAVTKLREGFAHAHNTSFPPIPTTEADTSQSHVTTIDYSDFLEAAKIAKPLEAESLCRVDSFWPAFCSITKGLPDTKSMGDLLFTGDVVPNSLVKIKTTPRLIRTAKIIEDVRIQGVR